MTKELSRLIIDFYERLNAWEHDVVSESGLTPAQMHAVEMIGHMGEPTMKALASRLGVTMGSLTVMIDRLEKRNLATRQRNPEDRRSYEIVLTESGKAYFAEHENHHLHLTEELCNGLEENEEQQFYALLQKIIDQF